VRFLARTARIGIGSLVPGRTLAKGLSLHGPSASHPTLNSRGTPEEAADAFRFDLTALAAWQCERNLTRSRASSAVMTALGALFVAEGAYVGFVKTSPSTLSSAAEGTVLIVFGIGLAVAAWTLLPRRLRNYPDFAVVSSVGVTFGRTRVPSTIVRIYWDTPGLRLVMQDRTKAHAKLGERDRFSEFTFFVPARGIVPISRPLFDAIRATAERRGFTMKSGAFSSVQFFDFRAPGRQ